MFIGTKVEQVTAVLEGELLRGEYRGPLPAEPLLARRFGVCRSTIREAVARLTAKGLVSVRPAYGILPSVKSEWTMDRMVELVAATRGAEAGAQYLEDLLETRRLVFAEIIAVACTRRSTEDVGMIAFLVWDLELSARGHPSVHVRDCERDVLDSFVVATRSMVLGALYRSIEKLRALLPAPVPPFSSGGPTMPVEVYQLLSGHLEHRAAEPARNLVLEALLQSHRQMKELFQNPPPPVEDLVDLFDSL
ncbi:MAG: FadR/GntR family transcriptional regulator [Myxococcaceae bacterium]